MNPLRITVATAAPAMNPAQQEAVEHQNGPMLVLAGAGSGKTRVITHRIARLIERGVPAHMICALTFTNKAAGEMAERVAHIVKERRLGGKDGGKGLVISTFHSFGLMVLGRERKSLGGTFTIFDQGDCLSAVKEILSRTDAGKKFDASAILTRISNAKNAFQSPEEYAEREGDDYDEMTKLVYPKYQSALKSFRAFDFDDLVCEVARLWKERADIRDRWQKEFLYVLVDEYQDTNRAQLEVLRLLVDRHKNICVVGDDDQSIYAWRGADVRNILDFDEQFPGAKVVKLEQNYRSTAPILAVANAVISKRADSKYKKALFTDKPGGEKVRLGVAAGARGRGRLRRARAPPAHPRRGQQAEGLRDPLSLERPGEAPRGAAPRAGRPLPHDRRAAVLRAQGGEGPPRLPEGRAEPRRRDQPAPHHQLPAARHRRHERREALAARAREGLVALGGDRARRRARRHPHRRTRGLQAARAHRRRHAQEAHDRSRRRRARSRASSASRSGYARTSTRRRRRPTRRRGAGATSRASSACSRGARRASPARGRTTRRSASSCAFLHSLTLQMDDEEEDPGNVVTLSTLHGSKGLEFDNVFLIGVRGGAHPPPAHARREGLRRDAAGRRGGAPALLRRRHARAEAPRHPSLQVPR